MLFDDLLSVRRFDGDQPPKMVITCFSTSSRSASREDSVVALAVSDDRFDPTTQHAAAAVQFPRWQAGLRR